MKYDFEYQSNINLNQSVKTKIDFKNDVTLDKYYCVYNKINNFYAFITMQSVYPVKIEFVCNSSSIFTNAYVSSLQ